MRGGWAGRSVPNRRLTLEERFWQKVRKGHGCWMWLGAHHPKDGRGILQVDGKPTYAPRLLLEWTLGRPLSPSEFALHHCDNPPCVRPDHIYLGTHADNMRDMRDRYRSYRSVRTPAERAAISARQRAYWRVHIPPLALRTHCPKGHEFTPENTYRAKKGSRICRACNLAWQKEWRKTHPRGLA